MPRQRHRNRNRPRPPPARFPLPNICPWVLISSVLKATVFLVYFMHRHHKSAPMPFKIFDSSIDLSGVMHSAEIFKMDYEQMEKEFKIFIYPDGERKSNFYTPRKFSGKYASEKYFFKNIRESRFLTNDPEQAHMFFIPISCHNVIGQESSHKNVTDIVKNYVQSIIFKHPYWNRTLGADHFFVSCHDFGVEASEGVPLLVKNSIRVVCPASYSSGYIPHKDIALPQVVLPFALPAGTDMINRTVLAFWAGKRSSKLRDFLVDIWGNDPQFDIQSNLINTIAEHSAYLDKIFRSKFCLCPRGSKLNSACITESIYYGCVPVILSNYYDLPFNDIFNWKKFSLILREEGVADLKNDLLDVSDLEYTALHLNLLKVQKIFQWHSPPTKYDFFHLIMYELWLRRHVLK